MSLQGKVAYIAGGTGIIGSGIAVSLLKAGAKVYISSRDENKIKQLKNSVPEKLKDKLVGIRGSPSNEKEISQIRDIILNKEGKIDHVFSSLGAMWEKGKLSDQSLEEYNSVMTDYVTSHFLVYKTFAKDLAKQPGSTYTFITGGGLEMFESGGDDFVFFTDSSLVIVGGTGVYGLYNAAKAEFHKHPNLKISQLRVFIWVRPKDDSNFDPATATHEVGNDFVGRFAVKIAEKHRGGILRLKSRKEGDEEYKNI